jgi:predicted NAD-dependent protein-ADP-ribosyltransferase YbiA (DUF1768 family)
MVASKINNAVLFAESKTIDSEDIGHPSHIYELDVFPNEPITIVLGKLKYTFTDKNVIFIPIYAVQGFTESVGRSQSAIFGRDANSYELRSPEFPRTPSATRPEYFPIYGGEAKVNWVVRSQIGVFEIESNKLIRHFKNGELDILHLSPPVLYSFVNKTFIQRLGVHRVEGSSNVSTLAKLANIQSPIGVQTFEIGETLHESERPESDPTFQLRVPLTAISQEKRDIEQTLHNGIFAIDKERELPNMLVEETEIVANQLTGEYRESAKNNWLEKRMKNNHYRISEVPGDGDCYFTSIKNAFAQIGRKTTVDKLRAILSNEVDDELFQDLRNFYLQYETIIKRIQSKQRQIKTRISNIKKQVDNIEISRETKVGLIEEAKLERDKYTEYNIELKSVEKSKEDEIGYMKYLDTLDKYREYVRTQSFWADEWAISTLERVLNFKTIIFSKEAYEAGSTDDVLKCGIASKEIESRGTFTPEFYIMVSYTGNHYDLITYRDKGIFKFTEIPYHVKMLILNKCLEKNAGPYYLIQDFRNYKSRFGIDENEGRAQDFSDEPGSGELYDDKTVLMIYHTAPNEKTKPGKVDGEIVPKNRNIEYIPLSKIPEWRKKLDDSWMGADMKIRNKSWSSVMHYVEGAKYRMGHPDIYAQFSIESGNPTAKDVKLAKSHKSIQIAEQEGKTVKKRVVKPDVDYALGRDIEERDMALRAKFKNNVDLRIVLLATKNALLLKKDTFGKPAEPDEQLMRIRKELQSEEGI